MMKTKKLQENAAQEFFGTMAGVASGIATTGLSALQNKKNKESAWITNFTRNLSSELKRAESRPERSGAGAVEESKLQEMYLNLISNDNVRTIFENKGHNINQTLGMIENIFEQTSAPPTIQHVFRLDKNEPALGLADYVKTNYLTKWLTPQQIQSISSTIDPILNRMATTYPNIARDLSLLGTTVYKLVPKDKQSTYS